MFRLGLIGSSGHWQEYARMLEEIDGSRVSAVAPGDDETPAKFDVAAGVTTETVGHADYRDLLAAGDVDSVQVCVQPHRTAAVVADCLRAGVPVMADKPLAMDERQLADLWRVHQETGVFVAPMHMFRQMRNFALARELVRGGEAGEVVAGHCQISFRWGAARPDWFRSRQTYPGTFAFIGIHAVDSAFWLLGDRFRSASGHQSSMPHPDYPACASLAYATVTLDNGGVLVFSADFLRPAGATSHGDVRLRLAGTRATLDATDRDDAALAVVDSTRDTTLTAPELPYWYTTFAEHVLGHGTPFIAPLQAFRVTELTLRIQQALDTTDVVDLQPTQISDPPRGSGQTTIEPSTATSGELHAH